MTTKYYLGIDLHKVFAYWHLTNNNGDMLWQGKVRSNEKDTRFKLDMLSVPLGETVAAIESVEHYGWYANILTGCGVGKVKLANPHKLRLIAENPLKNDKKDAEIIASYLRSGTLPESYLAPKEIRNLRELVRTRMYLAKHRTSAKIRIRNALSKHGLACRFKDIDGDKARVWLKNVLLPEDHKREVKSLLNFITAINTEVELFETEMKKRAKQYPEVKILKTIPGIADIRALIIMAEVGDFSRFPNTHKLSAFAGLVPRSFSSGGKERLGRITKRGSSLLRHAMVQAAQQAHPKWGELYTFYEGVKERTHTGAAKVALARKMLGISWYLVRKNEPFKARSSIEPIGSVNEV
jgi:transposase